MIGRKSYAIFLLLLSSAFAFQPSQRTQSAAVDTQDTTRRLLFQSTLASLLLPVATASAAERPPLDSLLYRIVRVREATQQEVRLIKSGKFKDVQRANVKLAVKFMVTNYRLSDAFVGASAYLESTERRLQAGQVGQDAVQNLVTILEYFDSSDVQNLKVRGVWFRM